MALEAFEPTNASQNVPLREKNEGTPETAQLRTPDYQGYCLFRVACATTSEHRDRRRSEILRPRTLKHALHLNDLILLFLQDVLRDLGDIVVVRLFQDSVACEQCH